MNFPKHPIANPRKRAGKRIVQENPALWSSDFRPSEIPLFALA